LDGKNGLRTRDLNPTEKAIKGQKNRREHFNVLKALMFKANYKKQRYGCGEEEYEERKKNLIAECREQGLDIEDILQLNVKQSENPALEINGGWIWCAPDNAV